MPTRGFVAFSDDPAASSAVLTVRWRKPWAGVREPPGPGYNALPPRRGTFSSRRKGHVTPYKLTSGWEGKKNRRRGLDRPERADPPGPRHDVHRAAASRAAPGLWPTGRRPCRLSFRGRNSGNVEAAGSSCGIIRPAPALTVQPASLAVCAINPLSDELRRRHRRPPPPPPDCSKPSRAAMAVPNRCPLRAFNAHAKPGIHRRTPMDGVRRAEGG